MIFRVKETQPLYYYVSDVGFAPQLEGKTGNVLSAGTYKGVLIDNVVAPDNFIGFVPISKIEIIGISLTIVC